MSNLLDIDELTVDYGTGHVIERLSLSIRAGELVGLVGESGCGKSTLGGALLGLLPRHTHVSGSVRFRGTELTTMSGRARRALLGRDLAWIPQSAMASLDPMYSVGYQLREIMSAHGRGNAAEREETIGQRLADVGLSGVGRIRRSFPHQLSGGMRQRVTIAAATLLSPALVIADEPTSSLDVTSQAQVLATMRALIEREGSAVLLITHDLGVVAQFCQRVAVMYSGRIVEDGRVDEVFVDPKHPYTRMLLAAHPASEIGGARLATIPGAVPGPGDRRQGCSFQPRCPVAEARCHSEPPWVALATGRQVRCVHHEA